MSLTNILIIIILILLNGFFVGFEFAIVSSRRSRLDVLFKSESHGYALLTKWLEDDSSRDRLIAAAQLGITVVSLALGAVGENAFEALLEPLFHNITLPNQLTFLKSILPALPLLISLIVVTSLHVVLGEQVPKVAALRHPERLAMVTARPMDIFSRIFKSFVDLLDWATRLVLGLIGLPPSTTHSTTYSLQEIKHMVNSPSVEGLIDQPERDMLSAVIDFSELVVRQVIVPRTEIVAVEANTPLEEVTQLALENSVTKLPVYRDSLDEIIGIIHMQDMLPYIVSPDKNTKVAHEISREAFFIPETISVNALLHHFRARKTHIAIVMDEFGGTSGLVTLEDLLDEIIGEVQDAFDNGPPPIQILPDGTALVDGMTIIDDVNHQFALDLTDENYDTIAGYVLSKLNRIAHIGDIVSDPDNGITFQVKEMDRLRISLISMQFNPKETQKAQTTESDQISSDQTPDPFLTDKNKPDQI
ncbi:MAG: HlyC/CorC family transporter [Anaerolineaceae bacterium]|nr:HlyC/CorC family transporter [Anaerolineaceae bacterium]